ncbi:hypothetical protein D3C78_691050 [compost metagenome]
MPLDRNTHAETAGMAATNARELLQANVADDRALMQGHYLHQAFVIRRQATAPELGGLKRHLQGLPGDGGIVVQRRNAFDMGFVEALERDNGFGGRHG